MVGQPIAQLMELLPTQMPTRQHQVQEAQPLIILQATSYGKHSNAPHELDLKTKQNHKLVG